METVKIPEALAFYLENTTNNHTVDIVVAAKGELPSDIHLSDLRGAANARLTAEAVRTGLESFLLDVWEKTWGAALGRSLSNIEAHNPKNNWGEKRIAGHVKFNDEDYVVGVWMNADVDNNEDHGSLQLSFWSNKEYTGKAFKNWSEQYEATGWEADKDWEAMSSLPQKLNLGADVDITALLDLARTAVGKLKQPSSVSRH